MLDAPENVVWQPQPGSQVAFLASTPILEVLYEGTRGGGKTDCLIMSFCQFVGRGYGGAWRGILFRQTYKQLSDVITKTKKWIPQIWPGAKFNHSDSVWTFPKGEQLLLRQFSRPDDYWNYHGHEYPWIGWEELCNWATDEGFKRMMSCCRSSMTGMPRMIRSTTNPYGPGHNWVKHRYRLHLPLSARNGKVIKGTKDENGRTEPPRVSIHSDIRENKILLKADPDYINRIAASARNEAERKAWLEGSWDIVAGGMFDDCWDPRFNVIKPFSIPPTFRVTRSFDWGWSKPFSVGWWAISDGSDVILPDGEIRSTIRGDVFRIREWYGSTGKPNEGVMMEARDILRGIVEREIKWGLRRRKEDWCRARGGVADAQIFSAENGIQISTELSTRVLMDDDYRYPGVQFQRADKRPGSRIAGWNKMRQMLKNAHPIHKGAREKPGMFIWDSCEAFLRTVPVLPRSEKDPDDVDTDAEDHVADETRYLVRYLAQMPSSGGLVGLH
jgi:hypothetical protein